MLPYLQVLVHSQRGVLGQLHMQQVGGRAEDTHGVFDYHVLHHVVQDQALLHIRGHHQSTRRVKHKVLHTFDVGDEEKVGLRQLHVGNPVLLIRVTQQVRQAQKLGFRWQNVVVFLAYTSAATLGQVPDEDDGLEHPLPFNPRPLVGAMAILQHGNEGPGVAPSIIEQNGWTQKICALWQVKLLFTHAADLRV